MCVPLIKEFFEIRNCFLMNLCRFVNEQQSDPPSRSPSFRSNHSAQGSLPPPPLMPISSTSSVTTTTTTIISGNTDKTKRDKKGRKGLFGFINNSNANSSKVGFVCGPLAV